MCPSLPPKSLVFLVGVVVSPRPATDPVSCCGSCLMVPLLSLRPPLSWGGCGLPLGCNLIAAGDIEAA